MAMYPWCCTAQIVTDNDHPDDHNNSIRTEDTTTTTTTSRRRRLQIQSISSDNSPAIQNSNLDLSQSADWMEWVDRGQGQGQEQQDDDPTTTTITNSAYDTLRCDFILSSEPEQQWNIWGQEFHLHRLEQSYRELVNHNHKINGNQRKGDDLSRAVQQAKEESRQLLEALLTKAEQQPMISSSWRSFSSNDQDDNDDNDASSQHSDSWIQLIKLTWLWTPTESNNSTIQVRGHACSTTRPIRIGPFYNTEDSTNDPTILNPSNSIVASLAASTLGVSRQRNDNHNDPVVDVQLDPTLPHRFDQSPHVKLSQWTRERKPLLRQQRQRYQRQDEQGKQQRQQQPSLSQEQQPDIGEVLLIHQTQNGTDNDTDNHYDNHNNDNLELLEGLSSNVFCIYQDGTLHTAQSKLVLKGFVRHLVLQCHDEAMMMMADKEEHPDGNSTSTAREDSGNTTTTTTSTIPPPILLRDVAQWREVFITSSSRLILPVRQIVIRNNNKGTWHEFWSSSKDADDNDNDDASHNGAVATRLRNELERRLWEKGGYKRRSNN